MSKISANIVSMQMSNVLKNLPDDDTKYTPEQVHDHFVKSAAFFENAVLREQIFKLYTLRLSVQSELK